MAALRAHRPPSTSIGHRCSKNALTPGRPSPPRHRDPHSPNSARDSTSGKSRSKQIFRFESWPDEPLADVNYRTFHRGREPLPADSRWLERWVVGRGLERRLSDVDVPQSARRRRDNGEQRDSNPRRRACIQIGRPTRRSLKRAASRPNAPSQQDQSRGPLDARCAMEEGCGSLAIAFGKLASPIVVVAPADRADQMKRVE